MKKKYISPFKPRKINNVHSSGMDIYTFNAGFKKRNTDLLIINFKKALKFAALFTKSATSAAPVQWAKEKTKSKTCKVLIVNSGNANAGTGSEGLLAIKKYVTFASNYFNCRMKINT